MTLGAAGGGTSATRSVAATGRRNGAEASRPRNAPQNRAGSSRRQRHADPARWTTAPAVPARSSRARRATPAPPVPRPRGTPVARATPGCPGRGAPGRPSGRRPPGTPWAVARIRSVAAGVRPCRRRPGSSMAPSATSAVTAASSNAPSGGRTTAEPGSTPRTDCTSRDPPPAGWRGPWRDRSRAATGWSGRRTASP